MLSSSSSSTNFIATQVLQKQAAMSCKILCSESEWTFLSSTLMDDTKNQVFAYLTNSICKAKVSDTRLVSTSFQCIQYTVDVSPDAVMSHQSAIMAATSRRRLLRSFHVREVSSGQTARYKQSEDVDKDTDPARCHLDPDWRPVLAIVLQYCICRPDSTYTQVQHTQ